MKLSIKPLLIVLASACFLIACSDATTPEAGKQYITLPTILADKTLSPVSEVFSLTCGHCRKMENFLPQISEQAGADIGKMHITFNQSAQAAAVFYYAAEMQLGQVPDHAFMDELFAAVQMSKGSSEAQRSAAIDSAFTSRKLITPSQFSEQQNEQLQSILDNVQGLSTQSAINAVPTFIVNGRYQVLVAGHQSPKEIADTIRYLLKK